MNKTIKPSAYKRELSSMPFSKTNGLDRILLNEKAYSLRLNSRGLKMQPGALLLRIEKIAFSYFLA